MAFFGLEAEEYDRKYGDIGLIKRILSYFYPYSKKLLVVIIFLTFSSLSNAFVPILSRNVVSYLEIEPDPFILIFIIIIIFLLNFVGWVFNYFQQKNSARVI
jgi:ABC-type multidrug transport system fused ATPase/permease subunit